MTLGHARRAWMNNSAIAGTIGTTIGVSVAFFLSIVIRPSIGVTSLTQEQIVETLFQQMLIANIRDGLCFGLALGISLAIAWLPLIEGTARFPDHWMMTTIISVTVGITLAYFGISLGEWYYRRSMLVIVLGGVIAGLIVGTAQGYVLWRRGRACFRWLIAQSLAFAGVLVLMAHASREIGSFFLFPFVWLVMWGIYGIFMGYTFDEIAYNYPNSEI